jgi:uroporphyrin-III C-methyltransferase/precorrin-2 dehydrogenase/sirohydrochlorin ferrochelatase
MNYLPLVLDVRAKPCLIVGGGRVAYRKALLLRRAGAIVHVVAPAIHEPLLDLISASGGVYYADKFNNDYLDQRYLVIAATPDDALNQAVAKECDKRGLLVNVVDAPAFCSVIFPAIIDRNPLLIAVSTSGAAPVLARQVRTQIESSVPANVGALADFIAKFRPLVSDQLAAEQRRGFWESMVESEIAECVMAGKTTEAEALLMASLKNYARQDNSIGEVYLVGAGPGDPDLLTFKALRLMQRADVVLYDRLVAPAIVDMTRRDAERIYVGKARSDHAVPQEKINQLLIDYALKGNKVVRIKGGDPFIFGRGGEEIEGLAKHNVPFQIVPGVSAANGCACYAGIPLTHRDHAQSVRFLTGHLKDGSIDLPWSELVQPQQTLVIYMGLQGLATICQQLIAHGLATDTAIALIERGTTAQQRTHVATLATIVDTIQHHQVHAPTLIIVGSVVSLHAELQWR